MKTDEMSKMLRAFSEISDPKLSELLYQYSHFFDQGKTETVNTRVKKLQKILDSKGIILAYPLALKQSLKIITKILSASGAKSQVKDLETVLLLFEGLENASIESLINQINDLMTRSIEKTKKTSSNTNTVNSNTVSQYVSQLNSESEVPNKLAQTISQLQDRKLVSTPTLHAIANNFLQNSKIYKGRKQAIEDIERRIADDAHFKARGKALERIGV